MLDRLALDAKRGVAPEALASLGLIGSPAAAGIVQRCASPAWVPSGSAEPGQADSVAPIRSSIASCRTPSRCSRSAIRM